jgi:radical SAM protein with 4Fe4S-binding SPASM domain
MTEIDGHKLMYHPKRITEWMEKGDCFPIYVEIGLTDRCNHKCSFCALDWVEKERKDMDINVLKTNLKDMAESGLKSIMFAGEGEPLLHKDICEIVQYAKKQGLNVSITSNGALFDKEKAEKCLPYLSWIRFSIDAGEKETYSKIHGVKKEEFSRVLENLKNAVKIKERKNLEVTIGAQFLLIPDNLYEVDTLAEKLDQIGVDNLQIKPYSQHPSSKNKFCIDYNDPTVRAMEMAILKLESKKLKIIYRKNTMQRVHEGNAYDQCYGAPFFALIDARGNVIPCTLFYNNPEFTYGNIYDNKFSDIWKSEKRKDVLAKLKEKTTNDCRHGCRLDPINKYLSRLKNPDKHDNFI